MTSTAIVPASQIASEIVIVRGQRVMLDEDLAALYGVEVKALNQAVKRNLRRFPADFMFQLTADEISRLRSQTVTIKSGRGEHRKYLPHAFTEQGVAMLSSVLHSERAIDVNVEIMRAFVRFRAMVASNGALSVRLDRLEKKYDTHFKIVFDAIRQLRAPTTPAKRKIGFGNEP